MTSKVVTVITFTNLSQEQSYEDLGVKSVKSTVKKLFHVNENLT